MARVYAKAARVTLVMLVVTNGPWLLCSCVINGAGRGLGVAGFTVVPSGIQKSSNLGLYTRSHMQS